MSNITLSATYGIWMRMRGNTPAEVVCLKEKYKYVSFCLHKHCQCLALTVQTTESDCRISHSSQIMGPLPGAVKWDTLGLEIPQIDTQQSVKGSRENWKLRMWMVDGDVYLVYKSYICWSPRVLALWKQLSSEALLIVVRSGFLKDYALYVLIRAVLFIGPCM
jgi:hypothetical protein